ncbi:MAG: DUF488 domain-containing protein [Chloroflexi bacterium]|nr:DUF488 domain-containing protein [Chloroflexota bacterium]
MFILQPSTSNLQPPTSIHTIGHSDHTTAVFVDLLRCHGITLVVDVRSQPYSRWAHQFNRETLARDLQDAGIAYRFMGDALGGRPADPTLYDTEQERPDYQRVEQMAAYQAGIDQLLELAGSAKVAVMCSEGDHRRCHRHFLITQTLLERGVQVFHIQPDGTTVEGERIPQQLSLFG